MSLAPGSSPLPAFFLFLRSPLSDPAALPLRPRLPRSFCSPRPGSPQPGRSALLFPPTPTPLVSLLAQFSALQSSSLPSAAPHRPSFLVAPLPPTSPPTSTLGAGLFPKTSLLLWHFPPFGNVFGTVFLPPLSSDLCCRTVQISPDSTLGKDWIKDENAYFIA